MRSTFFILWMLCVLHAAILPSQATDTGETGAAETKKLEGSVSVIKTLNNLKDARLSVSRVRKAIANLYDEMTREDMAMVNTPELVGAMFITTARPVYSGVKLPPRKPWVDASMNEIAPIIKLFKEDVDAAIESNSRADVSSSARQKLDPLRENAFKCVKASFEFYEKLDKLTEGPSYQSDLVASLCEKIDWEMRQLDKSLKKGMGILKKEQKLSKKGT